MLYMSLSTHKSPTFGTKPLPCRRFLQHYYRDTFIESHRKSIEVLVLFYACADSSMWGLFSLSRSAWSPRPPSLFEAKSQLASPHSECIPSHSFRSPNLQHAYSQKMKKWLFIQISPINHHFTNQNLHICDIFCTFAGNFGYNYNLRRKKHDSF